MSTHAQYSHFSLYSTILTLKSTLNKQKSLQNIFGFAEITLNIGTNSTMGKKQTEYDKHLSSEPRTYQPILIYCTVRSEIFSRFIRYDSR